MFSFKASLSILFIQKLHSAPLNSVHAYQNAFFLKCIHSTVSGEIRSFNCCWEARRTFSFTRSQQRGVSRTGASITSSQIFKEQAPYFDSARASTHIPSRKNETQTYALLCTTQLSAQITSSVVESQQCQHKLQK